MRQAFVQTLCEMAETDDRIVLLTGDLGYMALEPFRDRFPARFFNVGVAEQNLIAVANGLAHAGFRPYAYSIAPFIALRALEFTRNGAVEHRWPLRIIGMGTGFDYGSAGSTHYAVEDIAVMRTMPGLLVVVPADSRQAARAIAATRAHEGPIYYSLSKQDTALPCDLEFEPGRLNVLRPGAELAMIGMGATAGAVLAAADQLSALGCPASAAIVSSFNPDPDDDISRFLSDARWVLTAEAQSISGGLGACVAGVIATRGLACRLSMAAVRRSPDGTSGSAAYQLQRHGLDAASLVSRARTLTGR
jgi:transketolase